MLKPDYNHPDVSPEAWATAGTIDYFLDLHDAQDTSGITDAWKCGHAEQLLNYADEFDDTQKQDYLDEMNLGLPLAVALYDSQPDNEREGGIWIGLVKVNPLSGAYYPMTWGYVALILEDGSWVDIDEKYSMSQIARVQEQFDAQAIRGLRLSV